MTFTRLTLRYVWRGMTLGHNILILISALTVLWPLLFVVMSSCSHAGSDLP